jgi:hypothetical protein
VVCNPATQQWVTLPDYGHGDKFDMQLHLAVDPASVSGHFHLFAILNSDLEGHIVGVDIYSSETGAWSHKETGWAPDALWYTLPHSVFLHGRLHLITMNRSIVAVDTKGSTWKMISLPHDMQPTYLNQSNIAFIGKCQGRLHYLSNSPDDYNTLTVWILQGDNQWIPKHIISTQALFGCKFPDMYNISVVAIHPDDNTVFFTLSDDKKLMSDDMDHQKTSLRGLLSSRTDGWDINPYHPYVPSWRSIPC